MTQPVWSHVLALRAWTEESSYCQLPGNLGPEYKYLHASQIPHNGAFNLKVRTIPDCIRYIIVIFCYNFELQTNSLASY